LIGHNALPLRHATSVLLLTAMMLKHVNKKNYAVSPTNIYSKITIFDYFYKKHLL